MELGFVFERSKHKTFFFSHQSRIRNMNNSEINYYIKIQTSIYSILNIYKMILCILNKNKVIKSYMIYYILNKNKVVK